MAEQEESGQRRKSCCQECPTTVGTSICRFKNSQFFNAFLAACCPHTQAQESAIVEGASGKSAGLSRLWPNSMEGTFVFGDFG